MSELPTSDDSLSAERKTPASTGPKFRSYEVTPKLPNFVDPSTANGEKSPTRGVTTALNILAERLAKDPETAGLSLVYANGVVYAVKDTRDAFTLWKRLAEEAAKRPEPQKHPFPTTIYREPTNKKSA